MNRKAYAEGCSNELHGDSIFCSSNGMHLRIRKPLQQLSRIHRGIKIADSCDTRGVSRRQRLHPRFLQEESLRRVLQKGHSNFCCEGTFVCCWDPVFKMMGVVALCLAVPFLLGSSAPPPNLSVPSLLNIAKVNSTNSLLANPTVISNTTPSTATT